MFDQPGFIGDLKHWVYADRKVALRVLALGEAILRDPFTGIGKPEPLKYPAPREFAGFPLGELSRR